MQSIIHGGNRGLEIPESQCYEKWRRATAYPIHHTQLAIIFLQHLCNFHQKGYKIWGRAMKLKNLLALLAMKNNWLNSRPVLKLICVGKRGPWWVYMWVNFFLSVQIIACHQRDAKPLSTPVMTSQFQHQGINFTEILIKLQKNYNKLHI